MKTLTHKRLLQTLSLMVLVGVLAGCMTTGKTVVVDPTGPDVLVTPGINIQDWEMAAGTLADSLVQSGTLKRVEIKPALIIWDRIVNNTSNHVDMNLLTKKIRTSLLNSGQCQIISTDSSIADAMKQLHEFMSDGKMQSKYPDFVLNGRITEVSVRSGRTRQVSYIFQLSLIETMTTITPWEDEVTITKQVKKPVVGL